MLPKKEEKKEKEKKTKAEKAEKPDYEGRDIDKDTELKDELERLTNELENTKRRVSKLKEDNEWLEQEAQRITEESQEYLNFMSKKVNMRQNSIVTLSEHNTQEIENLKKQREMITKEFEEKKTALNNNIMEKQNTLNKILAEIEDMAEFKDLKKRQLEEIELLENEIVEVRREQTKIIGELRAEFLREKSEQKKEAETRINAIVKAANREARECLSENTLKIKCENQRLRGELLELIQASKELGKHKDKMERQREELLNEIKYAEDLKKIRSTRQKRVVERLFPDE